MTPYTIAAMRSPEDSAHSLSATSPIPLGVGLPGISVPSLRTASRPTSLLESGTLLLAGVEPGQQVSIVDHRRMWGDQPQPSLPDLVTVAERGQLVGAGGAGFPTYRKLRSMEGRRVSHVVVNSAEGEPASGKDGALLAHVPHLVLDGAVAVAVALRCSRVLVRIAEDRRDLAVGLRAAFEQRRNRGITFEVSVGPSSFIAGEATAVVRTLAGGPALPADLGRPPSLPRRRPGRRQLVFLSNTETFARLAQASRGTVRTSALVTVSGSVARPGVLELDDTATLLDASQRAGLLDNPTLLITGGWHGRWVGWTDVVRSARLTHAGIDAVGGRWGVGAFMWVPPSVEPLSVLAAVARTMAAASAGQCGPCVRGLPELSDTLASAAARGSADVRAIEDLLTLIDGRGICAHPTASAAAVRSALAFVAEEADA
jgi:NADH:ubiquinone oxidoreductase subunit F (NADH-binding)